MGADVALVFVFILVGGVFAAAEMAMVTLRESQIKQLATKGKRGRAIDSLTSNPNLFLSSVQIGVTLSGFLSAAFGGATIAEALAPVFARWGLPEAVAHPAALVLVTVVISYFSIVIGELTAKRLAMQRAEAFALALAPLVAGIARMTRPVIWFLDRSTNFLVRLLGGDPHLARDQVSDEELRAMVSSSATLGAEEQRIVDEVFDAGGRTLREVMVPRTEVDFLPADMPIAQAYREVRGAAHSRYPVTDGGADRIVGFLHIRDLMEVDGRGRDRTVRSLAREVLALPETVKILRALSSMRAARSHMAIVRDEYGGTAGIVTIEDLIEELIGDITDEFDVESALSGASWDATTDLDGLVTLEDFGQQVGYVLPEGPYDTVAGFVMAQLGTLPQVGDACTVELAPQDEQAESRTFELRVTELDGRRAARLRLTDLGPVSVPEA